MHRLRPPSQRGTRHTGRRVGDRHSDDLDVALFSAQRSGRLLVLVTHRRTGRTSRIIANGRGSFRAVQDPSSHLVIDGTNTRSAAFFVSRFSRKLSTVPRSVTVPSFAETGIAVASTLGSQKRSSLKSPFTSSSSADTAAHPRRAGAQLLD
jgi:hypothetical protein